MEINDEVLVLIPAAGHSRDTLGNEISYPGCLRNLNGRPIIFWIVSDLVASGFKSFRIGVKPEYLNLLENALISFQGLDLKIIGVVSSDSEVDTIRQLLEFNEATGAILINFGDSYCNYESSALIAEYSSAVYGYQPETLRWAAIAKNSDNFITEINLKGSKASEALNPVLAGVFWFKNITDFQQLLKSSAATLAELLNGKDLKLKAIPANRWIDSDHNDIFQMNKQTGIPSRSFNSLVINSKRGSITKTSSKGQKLKSEIDFYINLPENLRYLFPRMFSYEKDPNRAEQVLEYFPFRTISEVFTQENVPTFVWERIFRRLNEITFQDFKNASQMMPFNNPAEFFIDKILERSQILMRENDFNHSILCLKKISINGKNYQGLDWIIEKSRHYLSAFESQIGIVHGDFCFSNILLDIDSGIFKLIDPRGGFNEDSIYGPQIYDIAKLAHSVLGRYDFLIAGQFHLSNKDNSYQLFIASPKNYDDIVNLFEREYLQSSVNLEFVRLLSSLILLSIPLLHLDDSKRAVALFLNGIIEANNALEGIQSANLY